MDKGSLKRLEGPFKKKKKKLQLNFLLFVKISLIKLNSLHPLHPLPSLHQNYHALELNSIKPMLVFSIKAKTKIKTDAHSINPIS